MSVFTGSVQRRGVCFFCGLAAVRASGLGTDIRRRLISDLLREPHAKSCFLQLPRAVGLRARLAAVMYANHCYAAMCWLLCLRR